MPYVFKSYIYQLIISSSCLFKVLFFKTKSPIEPVSFVVSLCENAAKQSQRKQTRSVRRLTPVSLTGKATEAGIDEIAQQVLAPHFHKDDQETRKVCFSPCVCATSP